MTNLLKTKTTFTLDSREVSKMVDKRHDNLLRDITGYSTILANSSALKIEVTDFFQDSVYFDEQGKPRPCYKITKKGCELIANKLTGKKGILFTAAYVTKFNEMESGKNNVLPSQSDIDRETERLVKAVRDQAALMAKAAEAYLEYNDQSTKKASLKLLGFFGVDVWGAFCKLSKHEENYTT